MSKVLVANRGEIAIRIIDAVRAADGVAVAVHTGDDDAHIAHADETVELPGTGPAAYLDVTAIVEAAVSTGCTALHPGYGFLSESPKLAQACAEAGVRFIGPDPETLAVFGDKARSRELAVRCGVPVVPGTPANPSLEEAQAFARAHGSVMVKATGGGGGRGLRVVTDPQSLPGAIEECRREAGQAFGVDEFFVEKRLSAPRHIEVQVIGDGAEVQHAWERDCSVQRRHQKLVEVAPSPDLSDEVRSDLVRYALRIAAEAGLRSLATVEFLVCDTEIYFIEVNPRLQVEHTVTEQVTGLDLVQIQLRLAAGDTLEQVGLGQPPSRRGSAIQARVNTEVLAEDGSVTPTTGRLDIFTPPGGRYVRVETAGTRGRRTNPRFDSLLAKVIATGPAFESAAGILAGALAEFEIAPVGTNRDLLHAVVTSKEFLAGACHTGFLDEQLPVLVDHRLPGTGSTAPVEAASDAPTAHDVPDGATTVSSSIAGVVFDVVPSIGDVVAAGDRVCTIEAMKMEHQITADVPLVVEGVNVAVGDMVEAHQVVVFGRPASPDDLGGPGEAGESAAGPDHPWAEEIAEIAWRTEQAARHGGEAKVRKQHDAGKLTARERIDVLSDPGSFLEIGPLTGFGEYDEDGRPLEVKPSNYLSGTARLDGRKVLLGVDDFTLRGSSGDAQIHAKQIFTEGLCGELRLPMVRVLDGASGGGSVKKALEAGAMYLPVNPGWDAVVDNLSRVPVVSVCAGPTVGLGAARFVMSHLGIMITEQGQLFTAGPPVVKAATGEDLTKEGLGGHDIHRSNGVVERFVRDEDEAYAVVRAFLSYLPSSVDELPPVAPDTDPADRAEESLLGAVPRNKRSPYAIEPILSAIFDAGSVFRYAEYGEGTYTALARLGGRPVGVITSDPMRGATMSREGAQAIERLVDLCETFHLPLVSLTDQAGMMIGSRAERDATIRAGARAISAVYQARVPQAELVLRRVYGVGGAGIVNRHRSQRSWAWPSGDWGSLPPEGGIEAAFRAVLEQSDDPKAMVERISQEFRNLSSPFRTAEVFGVQDVIDPRRSRALLCDWVEDAYRALPPLLGAPSFGTRP